MNILISTTTNWNPGDEWIRKGIKNILKHIFPEQPNYIHYDRNPNNMIDWPNDQRMKEGLHGNFMNNPINWEIVDLVILAGTPEWLHHPLIPIYEGLVDHPEIPLWAIGVGYSEPEFVLPLSDAEIKVLSRENTLIITRQQELSDRLEPILEKKIPSLPCPALFCFEDFPKKSKEFLYIAEHGMQNISEGNGINIVYHSIDDMKKNIAFGYFSSDPYDTLMAIGESKIIISHRLHGAIAGISSGSFARLENNSFRCQEAIKHFSEVIEADQTDISVFKIRHLSNYINIIKPYYDERGKVERK